MSNDAVRVSPPDHLFMSATGTWLPPCSGVGFRIDAWNPPGADRCVGGTPDQLDRFDLDAAARDHVVDELADAHVDLLLGWPPALLADVDELPARPWTDASGQLGEAGHAGEIPEADVDEFPEPGDDVCLVLCDPLQLPGDLVSSVDEIDGQVEGVRGNSFD